MDGFETLAFTILNHDPGKSNSTPDTRRDDCVPGAFRRRMEDKAFTRARVFLQPTLGPAQIIRDKKGAHLEFHPRAHYIRELEEEEAERTTVAKGAER